MIAGLSLLTCQIPFQPLALLHAHRVIQPRDHSISLVRLLSRLDSGQSLASRSDWLLGGLHLARPSSCDELMVCGKLHLIELLLLV